MSSRRKKPQWWQLYVMLPALSGLFLLELRLGLTGVEHILAQLGILVLVYGFVHMWLGANRSALMGLDEENGEWRVRVYEIAPAELVTDTSSRLPRSRLQPLPDQEMKGVLSTTFEMDPFEEDSVFQAGSEIFYSEDVLNAGESTGSKR